MPQVRSIVVDAYVANWDAATEVDGLVLSVTALDGYGHPVPASGTVDVRLFADRRSRLKPQLTRIRRQFSRQGHWTRMLLADHGGETVYLLPFQAIHPEFDFAIAGTGLVHVRCAIPGHGVFEASVADVRIRPISPIRNQVLDSLGSRFLPVESTDRGR